ncbi:HAD-like domain-containing protein [Panaeolus papilionaceus]|nr:HAD-like domain-containing protein [Panaeolus papilionaceus]
MQHRIRLVAFDVLHTIITPRQPIYEQYSQVFTPYVGTLPPESIKQAFKVPTCIHAALKATQQEKPAYGGDAKSWWFDVIRCTALGAGANERDLNHNMPQIVDSLMTRFSSKEGYQAFEDAIPTIQRLHEKLGLKTIIISNGDTRFRKVLKDLEFPEFLEPIILSEEVGVEKPSRQIFQHALDLVNKSLNPGEKAILPEECLHIGDELNCDYLGAVASQFNAILLRRPGPIGEQEHKDADENLEGVLTVPNLTEIVGSVGVKLDN